MTQISISPVYKHASHSFNDSEFKSFPSSIIKEHSPPLHPSIHKPTGDTILNLKLHNNAEDNIAFNQNFLYRRENDQDPSTFTFPNDTKREHYQKEKDASNSLEKNQPTPEVYSPKKGHKQRKKPHLNLEIPNPEHLQVPIANELQEKSPENESYSPKTIKSPGNNNSHEFNELLVPMLKKFIVKLRNASYFRSTVQLKNEHYNLLDDAAYFPANQEKESRLQKMVNFFHRSKLTNGYLNIHTWDPYSPLRTLWDALHLLVILGMFFFVPLDMAFLNYQFESLKAWIYVYTLIFFAIDVFVNLNTGFYRDGILVKKRPEIFRFYIYRGLFLSDISAIFGLLMGNYFFTSQVANYLAYFVFGKISRMKWIYAKLTNQFKLQTSFKGYMDLFDLLMTSLLVLHLICCFWLMIALLSIESYGKNAETWLKLHSLDQQTWYIQYLYSFYWAVVTMMTVGYGDYVPQNSIETLYATVTIIFGCGVYGYYLNTVGILLQDIHKEENKYNSNLRVINMFMDRKGIDNELQMRVREYLRFIWNEEKTQNDEEEAKIINSLNTFLREELLLKSYGNILKQFPMFYANFSEKSLKKMVIFMKEVRFIPGDSIFFEEELDDSAIYFINKGSVEIFLSRLDKNTPHFLRKLKAGECFGELGFFTGQPREASARSLEFISVFMIKRNDFMEIIKENDDDYQKFCMIRDQIMLYNNCQSLRMRCSACGSLDHLIKQCHLLHFVPDVEKIIKKYEFYKDQPRVPNPRMVKKKPNGRKLFKRLQKTALKIQKELKKEKENEKNEFIRRKFMNGDYDTMYFNSEASISSEEEEDSLDDDNESSNESQVETNTFHTETNQIPSKVASSFENLMHQSVESNVLDRQMLKRKVTKERSLNEKEKIERNSEKIKGEFSVENFQKMENSRKSNAEESHDRIRETNTGMNRNERFPEMVNREDFQAKSEDNLIMNALDVQSPVLNKRHSAIDEMFFRERPTASFKTRVSRPSIMPNIDSTNIVVRNSIAEDNHRPSEILKTIQLNAKKPSSMFNDKRLDTSSLLAVNKDKEKEKSMGSKTSFPESKIMTRTKTKKRSKKLPNSMINEGHNHSNIIHSNIIHSKTSVGEKEKKNNDVTQTTMQQDLLLFFDQVCPFKNYFPESNVGPVLDIYDKKRRKLMFLNEMKMLSPQITGNIVMRKGTHIGQGGFNSSEMNSQEQNLRKWSKYTFYAQQLMEKTVHRNQTRSASVVKRRRKEPPKPIDRKKSVFGITMMKSKKSNFFGEVLVNNGAKKGFTDFVFDIIKDPKFQKWKKMKKGKRGSCFFHNK